jgi:arylsulfatase A
MKNRRSCILALFILMLAGCKPPEDTRPPNIVIILADDLGYNDLGIYRKDHPTRSARPPTCNTPNIDRLASEGMRFTDFYAGAAVCSPSRAALLTGRNCIRSGIYNWIPPGQPMHLRSGEMTIAELLKQVGYKTGHFGKWHLTSEGMGQPLPTDQGYDYAFYTYNNAQPSHLDPVNFFRNGNPVGTLSGYSCHLVAEEAIRWIENLDTDEVPFYINVWFNEPHEKVAAPESMTSRHTYHAGYYGSIENMDLAVERLLSFLENSGLDQQTIVIFTSDNGSQVVASNDPLRGEKTLNYEGGIRVPMIIRWPGRVPAGERSSFTGCFTDIFPTIASITGADIPSDRVIDGIDLSMVITGSEVLTSRNHPVFFFRYFHDPVCMLRRDSLVLLGYIHPPPPFEVDYDQQVLANLKPADGDPPWSMWGFQKTHMAFLKEAIPVEFELYDLGSDPSQTEDLSAQFPEVVKEMQQSMIRLRDEMIAEGGDWYPEE